MDNILTELQKEVLVGNLLGDGAVGYLKSESVNSFFTIGQKTASVEYLEGLHDIYSPFSQSIWHSVKSRPLHDENGKIYHDENNNTEPCYYSQFKTIRHSVFTQYRFQWYKEPYRKKCQKIIPSDLVLSWRIAAIWMCDDGSNSLRERRLVLHTECFGIEDVEFLQHRLYKDLEINSKIYRRTDSNKPTIHIAKEDWVNFIDNIKPFIPWQCFSYKCISRDKVNRYSILLKNNRSGTIGVCYGLLKKKWRATIFVQGRNIHLGWFSNKEDAVKVRLLANNLLKKGVIEKQEYQSLKQGVSCG